MITDFCYEENHDRRLKPLIAPQKISRKIPAQRHPRAVEDRATFRTLANDPIRNLIMTHIEFDREITHAAGEPVRTISTRGFASLTSRPYEQDREPLVMDWDDMEGQR